MSSMFPPSISIGGGGAPAGGPPGADPGADPAAGGKSDADVVSLMKKALELVKQASAAEPDEEDTLLIDKIATQMQQVIANDQKLTDQAMGAGPGAKLVRKVAQGAGGGAGGGY